MKKLTKEEIKKYTKNGAMTVGDLLEFIKKYNIPDTAPILIERVEDSYYEGSDISGHMGPDGPYPPGTKTEGWGVYLKKGDIYHWINNTNQNMLKEIERRKNGEKPHYSIEDPNKAIVELNDDVMTQYHPAWSCVFYKDDNDFLFIDLHY